MVTAVVAVLVGLVLGYAVAQVVQRRTPPAPPQPARPPDRAPEAEELPVERVLRTAVDALEIGVVVSDARGKIVYRNAAAADWAGTHVRVMVDGYVTDALELARSGRRCERAVEIHGPPRLHLGLVAEPMPNGLAVATITDVSERHRTEAMRTDFVANISHELKTPVGAIAVLAEALLDDPEPNVTHRLAERVVDESHRAVRTIDDLLELARIEAGTRATEVVDLGSVVREAVTRGRHVEEEGKQVDVAAIALPSPIRVRGDRLQLVSAMGNLVENAVKYSNDGGTVQIRVRITDRWVELMVADQGIGIPPRDLERVFERFYRVDRARSRTTGGTGLGLSIVRHVATNHGGDVQVSSRLGEGSTFVLRLPAALIVPADEVELPVGRGETGDG